MAVYAATKNAVRTLWKACDRSRPMVCYGRRRCHPAFVRTELDKSIDDTGVRDQIRRNMDEFGLPPEAVARAIAFA